MDSSNKLALEGNAVPHPGEVVREYLEFQGWTQQDLARRTDVSAKTISEICNSKAPVTTPTALALERALGRPASFWLNLQRNYDEAAARIAELAKLAAWHGWVERFPLREMRERHYSLPVEGSDVDALLRFFGVASPDSWKSVWQAAAVSYRQTRVYRVRDEAVAAWVREAEITAGQIEVADFSEKMLASAISELKKLTRAPADRIMEPVQQACAAAGVAVVWIPELPNTGISGCVRWMTDKKVLLALTLRYKTDDQMWFTLFHEIGHILLHRTKRSFVVDNAAEDLSDNVIDPEMQQYELEANRFSADTLISPTMLGQFLRQNVLTNESIHEFAEVAGIGPGIVVGRLQHDGVLKPHQGNRLKQRLNWRFEE